MDAVLLAGGVPTPDEPLYAYTQGQPKALIDVAGKPMGQWVLDALDAAERVERVVVVGLRPTDGLQGRKVAAWVPNQGGLLPNILAGLRALQELSSDGPYALLVSADIPAVTGAMLDWVVRNAEGLSPFDVAYHVVLREVMERRFPTSRRTYTRLKDVEVCGADANVVRIALVDTHTAVWERLLAARKNPVRQAAVLGWDVVLGLLLRRYTLDGAVQKVARRLKLRAHAVPVPYAELAMDADKPHQMDLLRRELAQREWEG